MATGAEGVYVDDRRAVSILTLHLGDESPVPVAEASSGDRSDFFGCVRQLGNPGADPTVHVRRLRTVTAQGITERIDITSRADQSVETKVAIHVGGDEAPMSAVKDDSVPSRVEEGAQVAREI